MGPLPSCSQPRAAHRCCRVTSRQSLIWRLAYLTFNSDYTLRFLRSDLLLTTFVLAIRSDQRWDSRLPNPRMLLRVQSPMGESYGKAGKQRRSASDSFLTSDRPWMHRAWHSWHFSSRCVQPSSRSSRALRSRIEYACRLFRDRSMFL